MPAFLCNGKKLTRMFRKKEEMENGRKAREVGERGREREIERVSKRAHAGVCEKL